MQGKRVLITGATTGIGRVTALELAKLGAEIVLVARSEAKAQATAAEIRAASGREPVVLLADLASLSSVRQVAAAFRQRFDRLDVLINNAGAVFAKRELTVDGFEHTFALNHLSYFLLTNLLLDRLKAAGAARVVNVASNAHYAGKIDFDDLQAEKSYFSFRAYSNSKLANVLFTFELARRLAGTQVTSNCVHPGAVRSGFGHNNPGFFSSVLALAQLFMISPEKGARTSIYLASSPEVQGTTGKYFDKCKPKAPSKIALDEGVQRRLWEASARLVGLAADAAA
jgi:NAD(P)-dependent dehydrogenase (short-subunit alcohol dehydrogenase family)